MVMGCVRRRRGVYTPHCRVWRGDGDLVDEGGAENCWSNEMGNVCILIGRNFPFIPQNRQDLWFSDVQGAP